VLRAAGAAVAATDAVLDREVESAFCAVRPPGHHATRDQAMGFCFFNNVAHRGAPRARRSRPEARWPIVDFDVHHGNGTEDIIAGDERVLMVSIFQHPLYPYSGAVPKGTNMINVPVPPYTRGPEIRDMIEAMWMPRLESFKPRWSSSRRLRRASRRRARASSASSRPDYEWITRRIKDVADRHAQGRIVSCLEGGYNLGALARSVAVHLRVLADLQA
jgi:acetoin utilization deacetylase AcuC-like enzyme